MDFLLDALGGIASQIFSSVAHLLNPGLDIVSSWIRVPLAGRAASLMSSPSWPDRPADDEERAGRTTWRGCSGTSGYYRDDLPQMVIGMAGHLGRDPVVCSPH